jgi:hypothetical protein
MATFFDGLSEHGKSTVDQQIEGLFFHDDESIHDREIINNGWVSLWSTIEGFYVVFYYGAEIIGKFFFESYQENARCIYGLVFGV